MSRTLFEKLWNLHTVKEIGDGEYLVNIDRIFLHERTGSIALKSLEESGREVLYPQNVFCTMDHIVSTKPGRGDATEMPGGEKFISATRASAKSAGINLFDINDPSQGIVHVVSPEQGITLPGITIVCPDSHTCTLGGLGALAWGVGSTDAEHALATKTLRVKRPKTMRVNFNGQLNEGVSSKDMILHLIAQYGTAGGAGYAVEFAGDAVTTLAIEARLTLCNMAVEFSAFTGLVAPDESTINYVNGRTFAPNGDDWQNAVEHWQSLYSDDNARFDKELNIDCNSIKPTVTWGTSPQDAVAVDGNIPNPERHQKLSETRRDAMHKALSYMDVQVDTSISDLKIDAAFIGSCTNSRLSDLRLVADFLRGKKVSSDVSAICVPGSSSVKRAAEAEGINKVFTAAGFEWRESGCSMCFYAGGETFGADKRVISSTNRNFEGRQGPGTRTHIASPLTVAASACAGYITSADGYETTTLSTEETALSAEETALSPKTALNQKAVNC